MGNKSVTICGVRIWRQYAVWLLCALLSIVAGIIASVDSPFTHSVIGHIDSAWFLDAGRWLMQGYTPYVDFADSKGPLLWLFYGIGYLLDNDGWDGMFWLYVLYYIPVYRCAWSLAVEFTGSYRWAAAVGIFMPYAYMCPAHLENRAEDLIQLPLIYMLLLAVRALKGKKISTKAYFWAGVGMGCMLFVKWSFPALLLPLPFIVLAYDSRNNYNVVSGRLSYGAYFFRHLGVGVAGVLSVIIAVSLWMVAAGSLNAMIQEYFIATFRTVGEDSDTIYLVKDGLADLVSRKFFLSLIIVLPISTYLRFGGRGLWIAGAGYWMIALSLIHYISYYFYVANSFWIFVPALAAIILKRYVKIKLFYLALEFAAMILILFSYAKEHENYGNSVAAEEFNKLSERVARIEKPRILYYLNSDYSVGIATDGRIPCKYWAYQFGATPEMLNDQLQAMVIKSADVVITDTDDFTPEKYGYYTSASDTFPTPYPKTGGMRVHWSPLIKKKL